MHRIAAPLALALALVSACGPSSSGDGGPIAHDCDQLRALCASAGACNVACDFAGPCCLHAEQAWCAAGVLAFSGIDVAVCSLDAGSGRDASSIAHDCAELAALCPSSSCTIACDFADVCCLHGAQAACFGGALSFIRADVGVCAFDAGPVAHDCDQLRALCASARACNVACDFAGFCCLQGEQAQCTRGALGFYGIDVAVCSVDAGGVDASTAD